MKILTFWKLAFGMFIFSQIISFVYGQADPPIKIGVIAPRKGEDNYFEEPIVNGIEYANKYLSENLSDVPTCWDYRPNKFGLPVSFRIGS